MVALDNPGCAIRPLMCELCWGHWWFSQFRIAMGANTCWRLL